MTDWTDKALDFMTLYDEEKALWQLGKTRNGRWVVVRHSPVTASPSEGLTVNPYGLAQSISEMMLQRHDFASESEARAYIRVHAAEAALKEMFATSVEVALR